MKDFKQYKLSDLYSIDSGISISKDQSGFGYPFLSFKTVFNNYFLPPILQDYMNTTETQQKKYSIKQGDIFLTRTSETNDELAMSSVALKDYPTATYSGFLKRLRPKNNGVVYEKYIAFYLRNNFFRKVINNYTSLTLRASFNEELFSYLSVYLPSYQTQKIIGDLLFLFESKISTNNSTISKLEEMAKTIYEYWFLQFDFPNQEGKPYASSGGAMKYSEELGRAIPSDWEVRYTNHFCEVQTGSEDANFATPQGKYKFFTCAQESYQCDTPAFEGHAILIAGNGDFNVKHYTGEFNAYQRTYVLLPKKQNYALLYFVVQQRIAHFKKGSNGSIVKFIRKSDVENIPIPYPNDTKILNTLNHFILMKEQKMSENQKLAQLRDWLLPMLMNGQVRVE